MFKTVDWWFNCSPVASKTTRVAEKHTKTTINSDDDKRQGDVKICVLF